MKLRGASVFQRFGIGKPHGPDATKRDISLVAGSGMFNAQWYCERYPDILAAGIDPLKHFLKFGGREGRAPGPRFHALAYLTTHRDVALSGENPLVHFLKHGQREARRAYSVEEATEALGFSAGGDLAEETSVALIAATPLFDRDWYLQRYPEVTSAKLDPILFFYRLGGPAGHIPSPGFDATAYVARYPDVIERGLNPLVHYLRYGQAQQAVVERFDPARTAARSGATGDAHAAEVDEDTALALLKGSPLFDMAWYAIRYPEVAKSGLDPLVHYLRYGGPQGFQPSLYFDPAFYAGQAPKLAARGVNPLVHFLLFGRKAGLKPSPLNDGVPPPRAPLPLDAAPSPLVTGPILDETLLTDWTRGSALPPGSAPVEVQIADIVIGRFPDVAAAAACRAPVAAFRRLMKLADTDVTVTAHGQDQTAALFDTAEQSDFRGLGAELSDGTFAIADAWFANSATLRVRFGKNDAGVSDPERCVLRAFQADPAMPAGVTLVAEAVIHLPGLALVDLVLLNPLMPVLLELATAEGETREIGLLPFPSLCRGGLHYAELIGGAKLAHPIKDLRQFGDGLVQELCDWRGRMAPLALNRIRVDLQGATGGEAIFSPQFREWLAQIFDLRVAPADPASAVPALGTAYLRDSLAGGDGIRPAVLQALRARPDASLDLCLPPDAIPTLAALSSRRLSLPTDGGAIGPYFVADATLGRPRWSVMVPPIGPDLIALQPSGSAIGFPTLVRSTVQPDDGTVDPASVVGLHLAIRRQPESAGNDALLLMPRAPDAPGPVLRRAPAAAAASDRISVVLAATTPASTRRMLESLAFQSMASRLDVILLAPSRDTEDQAWEPTLHALFPDGHVVARSGSDMTANLRSIADRLVNHFTLVCADSVILHDPRTLETLATMAASPKVGSAGCVLLRETAAKKGRILTVTSGGYFPSHISFLSAPSLVFAEPDCLSALPNHTYPVVANGFRLALWNTPHLLAACATADIAPPPGAEDLAFGLFAIGQGCHHLCTSGVRAVWSGDAIGTDAMNPVGAPFFTPRQWGDLAASVTVLREIRG